MEDKDKTYFSLDDSDEEIVEEEVIDRDEEYDYEDDDYDEDEEYDDEEYDDEDYDEDEDYEEEEDYDDGYNDDYYDDRLNKVLDEIAEIKRGMAPSTSVQPQPPFIPQYIYQPNAPAPAANSEVVMYNEISRLRDELAKNQSSLEMQKELTRMKEDMARDQKYAEAQYNAEIRRLQDRIDDLLKNASGPQSEQQQPQQLPAPAQEKPLRLEGAKGFDKLITINEAVLRATKDSDAHIREEIEKLKEKLESLPSGEELNKLVEGAKTATEGADNEMLVKLSKSVEELRLALSERASVSQAPIELKVVREGAGDVGTSELLRQLYEVKAILGSASEEQIAHTQKLLELVGEYKTVEIDVNSQAKSYRDKLNAVSAFGKKLVETNDSDVVELANATNVLIASLSDSPLTRSSYADISGFCADNGITSITPQVREDIERFFTLCDRVNANVEDVLPELIAQKNKLEGNSNIAENNELVKEITAQLASEPRNVELIKRLVTKAQAVRVGAIATLPAIEIKAQAKENTEEAQHDSIFAKLVELKNAIEEHKSVIEENKAAIEAQNAAIEENKAAIEEQNEAIKKHAEDNDFPFKEVHETPVKDDFLADPDEPAEVRTITAEVSPEYKESIDRVNNALSELRESLQTGTGTDNVGTALEEIRQNYIDLSERLVSISESINAIGTRDLTERLESINNSINEINSREPEKETVTVVDDNGELRQVLTDEDREAMLNDLAYIRDKLNEYDTFISQIGELRNDINNISGTIDFTEQFNAQLDEISNQFDKLYDDISNVIIESENNIVNSLNVTGITDSIENAKTEILTEAQSLRDILYTVSDSVNNPQFNDAIENLRADLSAFADLTAANVDASAADRQKLLEDVAYLRDQVDVALANSGNGGAEVSAEANERVYTYLDDISARIGLIANISEDTAITKDTVGIISDNVTTVLDELTPINDRLNAILDRLDAAGAGSGEVETVRGGELVDDINEIKDNLNTILDTLPLLPQSDDLVTARDNTYAILDTLTTMPLSEDIVNTRDNVVAILDTVNAIAESLNGAGGSTEDMSEVTEDVKFIRQKLENPDSSLTAVVDDINAILDRLETIEQTAAANKQEIVDAVVSVREKIHINELDETMTAVGIDDATRETLVTEIADVRERLTNIESTTQSINDYNATLLDDINERLTALAQSLENGAVAQNGAIGDESLQAIIDGLADIIEKIDAQSDYDTVAEILSLREDVKAARIVDQNEVSGELESIKNELAAISSGNILDEVRALRDDIAALTEGGVPTDASNPTGGELNLVLNEIVSLRDEVFALRDEVLNTAVETEAEEEASDDVEAQAESDDSIGIILDELTALRVDQNTLGENINELKDAISRRTKIDAVGDDGAEVSQSDELNVVLDEIINLKNEIEHVGENMTSDRFDEITAQVAELRELIENMHGEPAAADTISSDEIAEIKQSIDSIAALDLGAISEQLDNINAAISDIQLDRAAESGDASGSLAERFDGLYAEIDDIKAAISAIVPSDVSSDISELRAEIEQLKAENEQLRAEQNAGISEQLNELRDAIRDMAIAPAVAENGDTSYAALIDEIRALRSEVSEAKTPAVSIDNDTIESLRDALAEQTGTNIPLAEELGEIRDEIAQLRSLATVTADSGSSAEVAAIRNELAQLRSMLSSSDNLYGLAEDVTVIRSDVQTLKEEPDLGVMSEILALRDEFQALREEIEDVKRIAGQTDVQSDEKILAEVQSLRDQLFAISMANVNDSMSGENNYESYNNLILDELTSLQASIASAGSSDEIQSITDELTELRASIDKRESAYDALARRVARLDNDATNNKILEALDELHTELANQREADLTTLNFMSEMAHLLERQNSYIAQNTGSKISDEIESLKAELATTDTVAGEIAKLREYISNTGDNDAILNELAELREQLNAEKPSNENELILQEISRLRDEMTALGERENRRTSIADDDLSDSLSDLKSQLNEIADIIEPEKSEPAPKKQASKRGRPKGATTKSKTASKSKSGSGKKSSGAKGTSNRGRKPKATTAADTVAVETPYVNDLDAKITEQSARLGVVNDYPSTKDVSDRLDKLAQRVANKLIIEQLVEQLGENGKTEEQVDRILGNLPNELTTVALDEQSEQVRRLANELAASKLNERLNPNSSDDDDE